MDFINILSWKVMGCWRRGNDYCTAEQSRTSHNGTCLWIQIDQGLRIRLVEGEMEHSSHKLLFTSYESYSNIVFYLTGSGGSVIRRS